jgi:hypothetical protein
MDCVLELVILADYYVLYRTEMNHRALSTFGALLFIISRIPQNKVEIKTNKNWFRGFLKPKTPIGFSGKNQWSFGFFGVLRVLCCFGYMVLTSDKTYWSLIACYALFSKIKQYFWGFFASEGITSDAT